MDERSAIVAELESYFSSRIDVGFAFLFGSAASGRLTRESDVDIAAYFVGTDAAADAAARAGGGIGATRNDASPAAASTMPPHPDVELHDVVFPAENEVHRDLERICERPVDLVVLNRVPATLAAAALLTGTPLAVNDEHLFQHYRLIVTTLAEEERSFAEDFTLIKARSRSLSDVDRGRLVRIVDFLADELDDADEFTDLDLERYTTDRGLRRSAERWVENLVNASIDAAKTVLASERRPIPQTYRETLEMLGTVKGFAGRVHADRLAENTRVRNMLAHEYLDLRYTRIHDVIDDAVEVYGGLLSALRERLGE